MASYHQVVPAFCVPIPTKSGAAVISPAWTRGGVGSKPSSHGAYLRKAWSTDFLAGGGSFMKAADALRRSPLRPPPRVVLFPESITDNCEWKTDVSGHPPSRSWEAGSRTGTAVRSSNVPCFRSFALGHSVAHVGHGHGLDPLRP